jgi:predicted DCC family thiol-disulfide oxidoreductase YuxK
MVENGRPVLVYDGECEFCSRLARWVARRGRDRLSVRPSQEPGLIASLGLTRDEVARASWVVEPGGRRFEGAAAINRVLGELGGVWALVGSMYLISPVGWLEDRYYARVARRRRWW